MKKRVKKAKSKKAISSKKNWKDWKIKKPKVLIVSALIVIAAAMLGSMFTDTTGWYQQVKPAITPPGFVFGIVWTTLFALLALAIYFSWTSAKANQKSNLIFLFGANLTFNVFWSFAFFKAKMPLLAFVDLILLLATIVALVVYTRKISTKAFYMLLPYLLWVTFAGILNYLIAF